MMQSWQPPDYPLYICPNLFLQTDKAVDLLDEATSSLKMPESVNCAGSIEQ